MPPPVPREVISAKLVVAMFTDLGNRITEIEKKIEVREGVAEALAKQKRRMYAVLLTLIGAAAAVAPVIATIH
jgi:hypothetical protein